MTSVASSAGNYWEFYFFPFVLSAHFCLLFFSHFSSCLLPPLRCSLYWNSNGSRVCVCVWPARAVIEPICRLAPVGLNPGLTALRWLNAFAVFLKPILPPPPLHTPLLLASIPWQTLPTFSPRANKFFIEIDALYFPPRLASLQSVPLFIYISLFFMTSLGRFMCQGGKKKNVKKWLWRGSW